MLSRVLEPEVMDTVSEAEDYNAMDHAEVNRVFVDDFLKALAVVPAPDERPWRVFDAGTGTALIPIELLRRGLPAEITAADLADEMLRVARRNLDAAGLESRVRLIRQDCKRLSEADGSYDAVMSNSILHHIPEPVTVLRECWRIVRPNGLLFVRDLFRPPDLDTLDHLVKAYAGTENEHARQMFRDSLHAALTVDEAGELAEAVGIPRTAVKATSDRHWTLCAIKA